MQRRTFLFVRQIFHGFNPSNKCSATAAAANAEAISDSDRGRNRNGNRNRHEHEHKPKFKQYDMNTVPATATARSNCSGKPSALYSRVAAIGDPHKSVVVVIEAWINEGNRLRKNMLERIIKNLCKYEKYVHALQVLEWMDGPGGYRLGLSDYSVRLDLISKVHGITSAEEYFNKLPEKAKNPQSYAALLNGYVRKDLVEKAEQLMSKMKKLNLIVNAIPYNNMMTLFYKNGQPEKVNPIIQEMKSKDVVPDAFTYIIWMRSSAATSGLYAAQKVFDEMRRDTRVKKDWSAYSNLASVYIDAGDVVNAEKALKIMEKQMSPENILPHNFLLTTYAGLGNLVEVHRVWQLIRERFSKITNTSYICFLTALVKLGDIKGAEKYFEQWEDDQTLYDIRVPNILIGAYINEGKIGKAEKLLKQAKEKGGKPIYKTWDLFVGGYLEKKQMDLAIEAMKNAVSKVKYRTWQPDPEKALAILKYFEELGDVDGAEDMFKRLRHAHHVTANTYNSLIRTYIQAKKSAKRVLQRMKIDNIASDLETNNLIKQIESL